MMKVSATCASKGISSGLKYIFVSSASGSTAFILAEVSQIVDVAKNYAGKMQGGKMWERKPVAKVSGCENIREPVIAPTDQKGVLIPAGGHPALRDHSHLSKTNSYQSYPRLPRVYR
jgi:hypothetical protein